MSTVAHFSLERYEHMVDVGAFAGKFRKRVELVRGEIVEMTPIGAQHSNIVTLLTEWSYEVAPRDRIMIRTQNPIRIPHADSEPEPDVAWVARRDYSRHPGPEDVLLLIEVAESSLDFDRGEKLALYADAGIAEYWIVNLFEEQIEVYHATSGGQYAERSAHRGDDAVRPLALGDAAIAPARLFDA